MHPSGKSEEKADVRKNRISIRRPSKAAKQTSAEIDKTRRMESSTDADGRASAEILRLQSLKKLCCASSNLFQALTSLSSSSRDAYSTFHTADRESVSQSVSQSATTERDCPQYENQQFRAHCVEENVKIVPCSNRFLQETMRGRVFLIVRQELG